MFEATSVAPSTALVQYAWGQDSETLAVERHQVQVLGLREQLVAVQISEVHADVERRI